MKKIISFLWLTALSFGFYLVNSFVSLFLTFFIAQSISGGVSFIGFPVGLIQAMGIMTIINALIFFPIFWILTVKLFNRTTNKFKLAELNKFIVIAVSGLILSYTFTSYPIQTAISGYKTDKAKKEFDVNARIVDEKIAEVTKTYGSNSFNETVYQYTIVILNNTDRLYNVSIEVTPGRYGANGLFDYPAGDKITKDIKPGENIITGEYKLSRVWTKSTYPESGQIPISIRMFNSDINLDKTIYVNSTLPAWKDVFTQ